MRLPPKINSAAQAVLNGGVASTIFNIFRGRFTFAAIVFSTIGIYGWLHLNRDLTSYALFVGSVQTLLAVHSCKEDWRDYKNRQLNMQQQNTTVVVDNNISNK